MKILTKERGKLHMIRNKIATFKKAAVIAVIATMSFGVTAVLAAGELVPGSAYESEVEAPNTRFVVNATALRLRVGPSTDDTVIRNMPNGTIVHIENFNPDSEWSVVYHNGTRGYAATEFLLAAPLVAGAIQTAVAERAYTPMGVVEMLPWSYVRSIMPTGTNIQVYDVRTGLTYMIRNFSNGNHADSETLTQQDTDIMRQSSGGRFSWDARAVLVTFTDNSGNVRTVAAAINTMPHAGSTISGNGMNGHICLHFLESRTHNGNRNYEAAMQAAVRAAMNFANSR